MRLKFAFETMELDNQVIAVPVGEGAREFHGVIKLNETGARILELLKNETTEEDIVQVLEKEYAVSHEKIVEDVRRYVCEFQKRSMLV